MSSNNHCARTLRAAIKIALITAAAAPALSAFAQQAPAGGNTAMEEVVVTGFRSSLEAALDDKRISAAAIDSIKSEDIAKFPDSNLAEAVQRIPGVSISRDAGEGRNISVRGLGPQFTRVRINGMEAMSTTGGTDSSGGANRNRQFDFNVFAAELFGSITTRKTASADVDEGSLGATVDLQTPRPFDYKEFTAAASAQGVYNDLSDTIKPRVSGLISDVWADGHFGALFSAAYTKRDLLEEGFSTVRWDNGPSSGGFAAGSFAPATLPSTFEPRIPRYGRLTHEQERTGVTGALQWKINDGNQLNFDALYSDFKAGRDEDFLEAISFSRTASQNGKPQTTVLTGEVAPNGNLAYGVFNGVDIRSESRHDDLETKFSQYTLTGTHELTDRFTISELFGYSKSDFGNPVQTTVTLDRSNTNGYSWDFRQSDRLPAINYGYDVTDPANWVFANGQSEIRLRPLGVVNTFKDGQVDLSFKATNEWTFAGGLNYKEYTFETTEARRASETTVAPLPAGVSLASVTEQLTGFGKGLDIPAGTPTAWLKPNIDAFNSVFNIYSNSGLYALSSITNSSARGNNRSVEEKDSGAYVQANFNFDSLRVPLRGDVGVRYVKTRQHSEGYTPSGTATLLATADHDYSDVLPALDLVAEITPDFLLRFGAAKVMARPDMGSVTPGGSVGTVGNLTVSSGNPLLDPIRAKSYDLAAEWYFQKGALLSLAVFYKDIDSFVQTLAEQKSFVSSGLPLSLLAGTGLTGNEQFLFTQPVNTDGGPLKGFEINYQQPFTFLPGIWSHFGLLLNYTHVDSTIDYITSSKAVNGVYPTVQNDLTGLSGKAFNGTLYYEDDRFSIRFSGAYRDRYLTRVPASNAGTLSPTVTVIQDSEGTNSTFNLDMSASYNINKNFALILDALNLTDEFNDQFIDTGSNRVVVYTHTGREYFFGGRYKF